MADPVALIRSTGALKGADLQPSDWVARFMPGVRVGGTVLDLACGAGRHARLARRLGYDVVAVDANPAIATAFADDAGIEAVVADLETPHGWPLGARRFDGIIVTNYLHRPILGDIVGALAADGVLLYETFALGQERHGRPSEPDFLLWPNELLEAALAGGLRVVAFEQGEVQRGGRASIVQRIAAVGVDHDWAGAAPITLD